MEIDLHGQTYSNNMSSSQSDYLNYKTQETAVLFDWLHDSVKQTQQNIDSLSDEQWHVPALEVVNLPAWELGHLTWFHEFWAHRLGRASTPSSFQNADELFNSSLITHSDRWKAKIPPKEELKKYFSLVTQRSFDLLQSDKLSPEQKYFLELSIYHQDMHNEAFAYMCQTLNYQCPQNSSVVGYAAKNLSAADKYFNFPEQTLQVGSQKDGFFIFDNEKWQFPVNIKAFSVSKLPVSNQEYLEYLQANPEVAKPKHWRIENNRWYLFEFHQWIDLPLDHPVVHISFDEAQKYCEWKNERLPSEFEMQALLESDPALWQESDLWEWTSSAFLPFKGFEPDPYLDYSQPWFGGSYRVLKGYSRFTPKRLRRPQFRNFYLPNRSDPFCGFRTCLKEI